MKNGHMQQSFDGSHGTKQIGGALNHQRPDRKLHHGYVGADGTVYFPNPRQHRKKVDSGYLSDSRSNDGSWSQESHQSQDSYQSQALSSSDNLLAINSRVILKSGQEVMILPSAINADKVLDTEHEGWQSRSH
eukprot:CAMPEP_0194569628 /NCGR_PEP_ID=MMETSP0292-20121207/7265_1 /TAXON_ID=39354 /ORGANISM="Heterosigma akashiwo, Strain CCMP2393" /LENGTH=132 /DNA_ID=CAMNT_0039419911 /DNA_START=68 /DNA_END=466 /DNA_ORIENTATION=+